MAQVIENPLQLSLKIGMINICCSERTCIKLLQAPTFILMLRKPERKSNLFRTLRNRLATTQFSHIYKQAALCSSRSSKEQTKTETAGKREYKHLSNMEIFFI